MATNINNIDILTDRIKLLTNKKGTVSPSDAIHTTSTKYIQKTKLTEKRNQLQLSYADTKQMRKDPLLHTVLFDGGKKRNYSLIEGIIDGTYLRP